MGEDEGDELSPAAAFDLVGHDVRLGIIRELDRIRRTNWQWKGMTFAELRRAVGVRDAGNFSYHLDKLLGHFVVKDGEEYKLTNAGMELVGAVLSGTVADEARSFSEATAFSCPACERALDAEYDDEYVALACPDHGMLFGTSMPPGAFEGRSPAEIVRLATLDARQDVERARAGGCPHCWGPMDVRLDPEEVLDQRTGDTIPTGGDEAWAAFECDRCGMQFWLPAGSCVLTDPAVVAFYHDHGVDVRELPYPELALALPDAGQVLERDPLRIELAVERDGDRLRLLLDGDADVIEAERA
jgi:hypothetical protein